MTPLTVVLPYCNKDIELAESLVEWISELGRNKEFSILFARDSKVDKERAMALKASAMETFGYVDSLPIPVDCEYPKAATKMFGDAALYIQSHFRQPWLWLEPDCVPLKRGWLHTLAEAYHYSPRKFLGPIIRSDNPEFPKEHLNGVAIYPNDAWDIMEPTGCFKSDKSWDLTSATRVVKSVTDSPLIFQFWGEQNMPPAFKRKKTKDDPRHIVTPKLISGKAVLFHRDKSGSLIPILREDLDTKTVTIPDDQPGYWEHIKTRVVPDKPAIDPAQDSVPALPAV